MSQFLVEGLARVRRHGILDGVIHAARFVGSAERRFFYYGPGSPAAVGRA
jgi:hypothetical protein